MVGGLPEQIGTSRARSGHGVRPLSDEVVAEVNQCAGSAHELIDTGHDCRGVLEQESVSRTRIEDELRVRNDAGEQPVVRNRIESIDGTVCDQDGYPEILHPSFAIARASGKGCVPGERLELIGRPDAYEDVSGLDHVLGRRVGDERSVRPPDGQNERPCAVAYLSGANGLAGNLRGGRYGELL